MKVGREARGGELANGADRWAHERSELQSASASERPPGGSRATVRAARGAELGRPTGNSAQVGIGELFFFSFMNFLLCFQIPNFMYSNQSHFFILDFSSPKIKHNPNGHLTSTVYHIIICFI